MKKRPQKKEGFSHPWLDLKKLSQENFILLYPDQNTGGIARDLFARHEINPPVLLHTRNSQMSIKLAMDGMGELPLHRKVISTIWHLFVQIGQAAIV